MSDIAARVIKIVIEHMGVYPDKVTPEASFLDDLGGDSLDVGTPPVRLALTHKCLQGASRCELPQRDRRVASFLSI